MSDTITIRGAVLERSGDERPYADSQPITVSELELTAPGEGEILADLITAAHADARRKLDEANSALMRDAAGPMAGMNIPGMPKLF